MIVQGADLQWINAGAAPPYIGYLSFLICRCNMLLQGVDRQWINAGAAPLFCLSVSKAVAMRWPSLYVKGTLRTCPRKELPVVATLAEPKSALRAARREDATERLNCRS